MKTINTLLVYITTKKNGEKIGYLETVTTLEELECKTKENTQALIGNQIYDYATHVIPTPIVPLPQYDPYFGSITFVHTIDEFIRIILTQQD